MLRRSENRVKGKEVLDNAAYGILVLVGTKGTLVWENRVAGNGNEVRRLHRPLHDPLPP